MASIRNPAPGHPHYPGQNPTMCSIAGKNPTPGNLHPSASEASDAHDGDEALGKMDPIAGNRVSGPHSAPAVGKNLSGHANPSFGKPANRDAGRGNP